MARPDTLRKAKELSDRDLDRLRRLIASELGDQPGIIIGVNGSYARREATAGSDLDLFYLFTGDDSAASMAKDRVGKILDREGFKPPSEDGVFKNPLRLSDLTENIGGSFDKNETITRRMLLLLEGEWLSNAQAFRTSLQTILNAYVADDLRDDQICMFLLNDIIRYWRTMCVDYQYKVSHDKPKAIRLAKLRFSRMLLYFGGIIAVAETRGLPVKEKRERLEALFRLPTTERIIEVFGEERSERAISLYASFLAHLDSTETRQELEKPELDLEKCEAYQEMRKGAQEFRAELKALLDDKYPSEHPIHMALVF